MNGILFTSWEDALGMSHNDEAVAVFENGKIYIATDGFFGAIAKGTLVGEYENGNVYTTTATGKRVNLVGKIENGNIFQVSSGVGGEIEKSLSMGSCSCGKVYSHSHKLIDESTSFGRYSGDEEGAAAAAAVVLFRLTSDVSPWSAVSQIDSSGSFSGGGFMFEGSSRKSSGGSAISSAGSGLGGVLEISLFLILAGLAVAIFYVAVVISVVSFVGTWLIYKLVKIIKKRTSENIADETPEQKQKERIIILQIAMWLAIAYTAILILDDPGIILISIVCICLEAWSFSGIINTIKEGKELNPFKRWKKKKNTNQADITVMENSKTTSTTPAATKPENDVMELHTEEPMTKNENSVEQPKSKLISTMKIHTSEDK